MNKTLCSKCEWCVEKLAANKLQCYCAFKNKCLYPPRNSCKDFQEGKPMTSKEWESFKVIK